MGIFKATAYKEKKYKRAKVDKIQPKSNQSFETTGVVYEEETPQQSIDKEVEALKKKKQEDVLLSAELEKPFADRNKALMDKYGFGDAHSAVDNYPALGSGQFYNINIYTPEDPGVKPETRPKPWFIKLEFEHAKNKYTFRFPLHRYASASIHEVVYKLDGFQVFVDASGAIIDEGTEYTLFQALFDYSKKEKDVLAADSMLQIFKEYGIAPNDLSLEDVYKFNKLDFFVRGYNFSVTYSLRRGVSNKTAHAASVVDDESETESDDDISFTGDGMVNFTKFKASGWKTMVPGTDTSAEREYGDLTKDKFQGGKFIGTPDDFFIPEDKLHLRGIIAGKSGTTLVRLFLLTGWRKKTKTFSFIAINGALSLHYYSNKIVNRSSNNIIEFVKKSNKAVYGAYKEGKDDFNLDMDKK